MSPAQARQLEMPEEPAQIQKPQVSEKSNDAATFLKTPEAQKFKEDWSKKFPVRAINDFLASMHSNPTYTSDKEVLSNATQIIKKFSNTDGFLSAISAMKARPEGIIKTIGRILGGG
jgi:hypothetical protein